MTKKMSGLAFAAVFVAQVAAAPDLKFNPRVAAPTAHTLVASSRNGAGRLYTLDLPGDAAYRLGPVQLLHVEGTAAQVGEAYGQLLAAQIKDVYDAWVGQKLGPNSTALLNTVDFLWDCALQPHMTPDFKTEFQGIRAGGEQMGVAELDVFAARLVTVATLPADPWNLQRLIRHEVARHGNSSASCGKRARALGNAGIGAGGVRRGQSGFCDFFGAWGAATEGGRLLSSRNLDFDSDTGIAQHKLVTVYKINGAHAYATFGYAGFAGALAGMSGGGITVSEANLDNAMVAFDGLAWPMRLRDVMGRAATLSEAEAVWAETNNTAAFNFLLGSASDAPLGPAAVALETCLGVTGKFRGGSGVESAAEYNCTEGTVLDGVPCHWPGSPQRIPIGSPLPTAVFRTNHGMHPDVMRTQEPLWNDTVMRYYMMHDALQQATYSSSKLTLLGALNITALLAQKGADYSSCATSNFKTGDASNILSVTYDASWQRALLAFEDNARAGGAWSPAACNTYVQLDLGPWFK